MKQYITEEQLNELTKKQSEKIHEWYGFPKGVSGHNKELSLQLSIGKLIEFLDEHTDLSEIRDWVKTGAKEITWCENEELCDDLWEAVKDVL